jgi:pSer/pThr/pTyr-binding forkhead associated (FHA) protein
MSDQHKTQMSYGDPNRTQMGAAPVADPNRTMMGTAPSLNATQTIKPVQCPVCKAFNPAGVMFCVDCGLIFDRALPDDAFGAPAVQLPMLTESGGREFPLRPGENVVGREADVQIADAKVSRRHASVANNSGELTVEDLGSTNGTEVNGDKLAAGEKRRIVAGDKISFGGIEMQVSMPGAKPGTATQTIASNKTSVMDSKPAVEAAPATLICGENRYPLRNGPNVFGRRDGNDVVIPDPYVSGKHGQIEITDEGVFLTDLGSSNGTFVNEAKLAPNMRTQVGPEDVVRLGSMELKIERGDR